MNPASDRRSLCSDFASLDPLNIKQNNKQVRQGGSGAWREGGSRARPKLRFRFLVPSVCRRGICGLHGPSCGFWKFCHLVTLLVFIFFVFLSLALFF